MFGNETAAALAIAGWVPITLLTGFLVSRRRGYSGPDPRSALGLAALAQAERAFPADASQAHRVALAGLPAITDPHLRQSIRGRSVDSTWQITLRRSQATGIDLLAVNLIYPAGD
jgi:hypothetical protein